MSPERRLYETSTEGLSRVIRSPDLMPPSGRSRSHAPSAGVVAVPPLCAALAGATAILIVAHYLVAAAVVAFVSAALLVAVETQRRQPGRSDDARGRRLEFGRRVANVIFDAAILASLAWIERSASSRVTAAALVALGGSYLVSYQLARGRGLGYSGWESTAYRVATAALLVLAVLAGSVDRGLMEPPLWAFGAVVAAAALRRAWDVRTQDREPIASEGTA